MTTGELALTIFAAIVSQIVLAMVIGVWRRRGCVNQEKKALSVVADTTSIEINRQVNQKGWEGFKPFRVVRRVVENAAGDICSFYLEPCEPMTLPTFLPGQYLTFKFDVQFEKNGAQETVTRCYSLSDRPRPDYYRISVKRVGAPSDQPALPPGIASNYLHEHIDVGDQLMVKAPSGRFHLIEGTSLPLVLIAGGIGITPMFSIINSLVAQGSERKIWLFYGVRNSSEVIMHALPRRFEKISPQFHLHLCYSRPNETDRIGIDFQHAGHVDISLLRDVLKLGRYHYYICGPSSMMQSMVTGLQALGVPSSDIHFEAFGPASVKKPQVNTNESSTASNKAWQVTFSKSNKSAQWTNAHDSLLSFIEAEGIAVDSSCRSGVCGNCQTRIESGEVAYIQAPVAEVASEHCLLCISRPQSDLKLVL
jgi:ferredoxin-NADP reductase